MPTHILVNGLGLTYKSTIGVSNATIPDVCKTPSPGGPVPIPYPNIATQSSLKGGTKTVKAKKMMIAIKGSQYSRSNGDEPGTAGGVKSNVNMKATDWITYSFDVKMDGKNACRHTDKKFHNNQNTVDLAGNIDPGIPGGNPLELDCEGADLTECQKEEVCAKCNEFNKISNTAISSPQPGKSPTGPYKGLKRFRNTTHVYIINRGDGSYEASKVKNAARQGDQQVDFYPISQKCKDELEADAKANNWDEYSADHVHEIQLGGHPTSHSNLRFMSKRANEFVGRQISHFRAPDDCWGRTEGTKKEKQGAHTGLKPVNCGCA